MFVVFIGLIEHIFTVTGWKFYVEVIVLLGLLFFAAMSLLLVYNNINFGYILSAIISAAMLLNLVLFYFRADMSTLLFLSIISTITLFVVSVINIGEKEKKKEEVIKKEPEKKNVLKTYTPGKVVSSKNAAYYHVPKCDWAKKIKKPNQVWHNSDEEAKKAGLKPHNCAK